MRAVVGLDEPIALGDEGFRQEFEAHVVQSRPAGSADLWHF